ncbi:hypothetical protein [Croceiramulus getboli]|nr:hypothetical protein P8624_01390 [Flavobacteriaceae bacterium YJPT1-3]
MLGLLSQTYQQPSFTSWFLWMLAAFVLGIFFGIMLSRKRKKEGEWEKKYRKTKAYLEECQQAVDRSISKEKEA